jgi:HEAT repeat protein
MSHEANESAENGTPPAPPPLTLAAVLRMDMKGSTGAAVKGVRALLDRMNLLRIEVSDKETYPSLFGKERGEGDSIRLAFTNVRDALQCALLLRNRAQQPILADGGTTVILAPRIVLHFGEFTEGIEGRIEGLGQIVVTRLDHLITPGQIWATEAFTDIARHLGADEGYSFKYIEEFDLEGLGKYRCYAVGATAEDIPSYDFQRPRDLIALAMEFFSDEDEASQLEAIEALGDIESEAAARQLTEIALKQEVARSVRHAALAKLQDRAGDIDIKRFSKAFKNEGSDAETRALLLLVLGATGREEVLGTLSKVVLPLPDSTPYSARLREAALLAMRNLRGSLIANAVEKGLRDTDVDVQKAACVAAAAGRMPTDIQDELDRIIQDAKLPIDLRGAACEALASQKMTNKLLGMLSQFAWDRGLPLTLRRYAIDGLACSDDPIAVHTMEEIARRTGDGLRADAIIALAAFKAARRRPRRRAQEPESHLAEVIQLRTRPQSGGTQPSSSTVR